MRYKCNNKSYLYWGFSPTFYTEIKQLLTNIREYFYWKSLGYRAHFNWLDPVAIEGNMYEV